MIFQTEILVLNGGGLKPTTQSMYSHVVDVLLQFFDPLPIEQITTKNKSGSKNLFSIKKKKET